MWLIFLLLTCLACSRVHFEPTADEANAIETRLNSLFNMLEVSNIPDSKDYLRINVALKYNSYKKLEDHLYDSLIKASYDTAEFLIFEHVRIKNESQIIEVLNKMVIKGSAKTLDLVLRSHLIIIAPFLLQEDSDVYGDLMNLAVDLGRLDVLRVLNSSEIAINRSYSRGVYLNLAKKAMSKNCNDIFDYIVESRPSNSQTSFISTFLKSAIESKHFHVIKRCVEHSVPFIILTSEQRIEALRMAAMNDCETTTKYILKISAVAQIIKDRAGDADSPLNIAKELGKRKIADIYESIIHQP